jgi:hypothetical protein
MCDTQAWALSVPQRNHLLVAKAAKRGRQQPETKISARCHKYRPSNIKVAVVPGQWSSVTSKLNFKIGNLPKLLDTIERCDCPFLGMSAAKRN